MAAKKLPPPFMRKGADMKPPKSGMNKKTPMPKGMPPKMPKKK